MDAKANDNFPSENILDFWLNTAGPEKWFVKDEKLDETIRQKFGTITEKAQNGDYKHETLSDREKLALIITLDQFSRNLYRNSPKSFAGDPQALKLTKELLQKNAHKNFSVDEKTFLYLPLEHSENLADQELCVELYQELGHDDYTHYAQLHLDIIKQFGRFPHRNEALGRTSTEEERQFLTQPNSSF